MYLLIQEWKLFLTRKFVDHAIVNQFIMIEGPSPQNFCTEKAISHWLDGHKGHIGGHTMKAVSLLNEAAAKKTD